MQTLKWTHLVTSFLRWSTLYKRFCSCKLKESTLCFIWLVASQDLLILNHDHQPGNATAGSCVIPILANAEGIRALIPPCWTIRLSHPCMLAHSIQHPGRGVC
jgi:hypothetical protein